MNAVTITAHNRPLLLEKTVDSILYNDTFKFDHIFCAVEPDKAEENTRILRRLSDKFRNVDILVNAKNKGVRQNPYDILCHVFSQPFDFVFYLEDDQILSPDAFDCIRYCKYHFSDKYDNICSNLYNYSSDPTMDNIIYKTNTFCALGMGITRNQWEKYFKPYWFDETLRKKHKIDMEGKGGWDWSIRSVMKEFNLTVSVPAFSRSKHTGETGVHCDKESFDKNFRDHPFCQSNVGEFFDVDLTYTSKQI